MIMRVKVVLFLLIALCGRECKGSDYNSYNENIYYNNDYSNNYKENDDYNNNYSKNFNYYNNNENNFYEDENFNIKNVNKDSDSPEKQILGNLKKFFENSFFESFYGEKNVLGEKIGGFVELAPLRYFLSYIYLQGCGKPNVLGKGFEWRNNYYVFYEIGWFPKTLNFNKNFRIGIIDCGINIPIVFYNFLRFAFSSGSLWEYKNLFKFTFFIDICGNWHLLSFNFSSFFKIKIFTLFGFWAAWQSYTNDSKSLLIWDAFDFYHNDNFSKDGSSKSPWKHFNPIFLALMPRIHFSFYEFLAFLKNKSENEDENIENENKEEYEKEIFE